MDAAWRIEAHGNVQGVGYLPGGELSTGPEPADRPARRPADCPACYRWGGHRA
ncbi:hypothetical protein ACU635_27025 [[Actinomadura] parvosata]|uniref:hypothetical protein n=1 Tax=[Actinomadura] parvosata TaxID=1955412 RepID=UPI00406CAD67